MKKLELAKNLPWVQFRAHVIFAMCLATSQEEAAAYPADKAPMSYRFNMRGTFSTLNDAGDYAALLSSIETRQKKTLVPRST